MNYKIGIKIAESNIDNLRYALNKSERGKSWLLNVNAQFSKLTQRGEGRNSSLSQPAKELNHPWKLMRWHIPVHHGIPQWKSHFEYRWGLTWILHAAIILLIPVATPRHAINPVQTSVTHSKDQSTTWERKMKRSPFLLTQRNECPCSFLPLGHWIPPSFYLFWQLFH